jgi:glycosyltransferase involved in cell wall biosynthesis
VALPTRSQAAGAFSLPELLSAADVFVAAGHELTAVTEGAAALAIGLPVVALTTDATAELVSPGRSGIVVTPRPESIADAVVALVEGGGTTRRTPAPSRCPAEVMARELVEIYRRLAPLPPRLRRWGR